MNAILIMLEMIIGIYLYLVIAYVVVSWLINFNILNLSSPVTAQVSHVLRSLVEPALKPIRDLLAKVGLNNLGGIDISPVVLMLALYFLQNLVRYDILPAIQ
ncbi:MAG: YggT family protein [Alphaproteobacteria bacterium]